MSQQQNPIERAVNLFVYAPIGVAMFAKDTVPTFLKMFVSRGQTELQHRKKALHDQATQYRSVGKFAVKYGGPEVKRNATGKIDGARRIAEETFTGFVVPRLPGSEPVSAKAETSKAQSAEKAASASRPKPRPKTTKTTTRGASATKTNGAKANGKVPPAPVDTALAIPGYDQLSASQVVERLVGLSADELAAVRAYEIAHRGRSTILGKIVQLTS